MFALPTHRPALMGILNVTPDSFSDGGSYADVEAAVARGLQMMDEGADLVDVGGESTRPGSGAVPVEEELARTLPVVLDLASRGVAVSIDSQKPEVARQAILSGAQVVNDVGGLRDPEMRRVCLGFEGPVCVMHMRGEPKTMQAAPEYGDVVSEVRQWLLAQAALAEREGIARQRLWIDPGIGFGKTLEHNLCLLRQLKDFVSTGFPVLLGVSRKSFIGKLMGGDGEPAPVGDRLEGTLAFQAWAQLQGVRIIRAHDVRAARRVIDSLAAIRPL